MATLRKALDGIYFIDYRVNGRRVRKYVGRSKHLAELALKDLEVKLIKNELGFETKKDSDLAKLFDEYASYSATHHSPATQKRFKGIVENFKGFIRANLKALKISQLTHKDFSDFQGDRKRQGAAHKTINMEIACLRTIFGLAVKWGYAKSNPTDGVVFLKEEVNTAPEFLSKAQCKKILDAADPFMYCVLFTLLNTGMRKAELENLEWNDINFESKKIKIRYKTDWSPKTAERLIPINKELLSLLKEHKKKAAVSGCSWVFHRDGQKIEPNYLRKRFMQLTKQCGFPEMTRIHSLRHTFASHLVMGGVDLPTVGKLLGHSDIETTMIYSHLADEHVDKAVEKISF